MEEKEKIAWQNINSSKDINKILTGSIVAIETEKMLDKIVVCGIVEFKGVRILLPAQEISEDAKNDKKLLRNMMGANIRFLIAEIDKVSEKTVASRSRAMEIIQNINFKKYESGDIINGQIVGIWKKYIRLEVLGVDFVIKAQDLKYGYIEDVSKHYKINEKIKVLIKEIDAENKLLRISVKELVEDPFTDIRKKIVEGGEYLATITGYTDNRYFC